MDLTIQEVSTLLQVSEDVIKNWLDEGKIPGYKLQNEIRFSRDEIESWVVRFHGQFDMGFEETGGVQHFNLYRALHKGYVLKDVEGSTKELLIRNSVDQIAQELDLNPDVLTNLLLERENLMPTALNNGVAVPHTRDFLLSKSFDSVIIVYPKEPIEYGALDQQPVHTLFFLFACQDKRHLSLLAKIAYFCNQKNHLNLLAHKPDKKELLSVVRNWEAKLTQLQSV